MLQYAFFMFFAFNSFAVDFLIETKQQYSSIFRTGKLERKELRKKLPGYQQT